MNIENKLIFNKDGMLQVSNKKLEAFAYSQLKSYQKGYFKSVHPLNIEDFLENFLHRNIFFYKLSPNKSRLGLTAITDGLIPMVNDDGSFDTRLLKKSNICIDIEACHEDENIIRFTLAHEASHSQFDINVNRKIIEGKTYVDDDKNYCVNKTTNQIKGPKEWMEYHANKYASYILMPSPFVRKLYKEKHSLILSNKRLSIKNKKQTWKIIYSIAKNLKVSATSMAWRLLDLKIISPRIFNSLDINAKEEKSQI